MFLGVGGRRLLLVALALAVLPMGSSARKPRPAPCPPGRFMVTSGGPLVVGASLTDLDAIVIDGSRIGTDSGCALAAGKVKASKKGTIVRGKWSLCGTSKRVRLKGVIASPACDTMSGKVRAKRRPPVAFQAVRSRCGDGRLDAAGGEQCDGATGCGAGQSCVTDTCTCSTAPTTTTLPGGRPPVCGNGVLESGETCDRMALPSGCPIGQQCDFVGDTCGCSPIPETIGQLVAFDPGPLPDFTALGLPPRGDGTYSFMGVPNADFAIDPNLKDPITALGRCTSWIVACLSPSTRLLDDCARSAPACATDQPWLEAQRCCPSACFTAFESLRRQGASAGLALRTVYFKDASCFPGVRAMLGEP
jgi:hypothetical protein